MSSFNIFIIIRNILKIRKYALAEHIQLIHSHHRNDAFYAAIVKLLLNNNVKIVHTLHGMIFDKKENRFRYRILKRLFIFILNYLYDKIVAISEYALNINTKVLDKSKCLMIYNGSKMLEIHKSKENLS